MKYSVGAAIFEYQKQQIILHEEIWLHNNV